MADLTKGEIFDRLADRRKQLSAYHREVGIEEDFLEAAALMDSSPIRRYFKPFPKRFQGKIPSIARDVVDVGKNVVYTGETLVKVILPPSEHRAKELAEKHATTLGKKLRGLLWQVETYTGENPLQTMVYHTLAHGLGTVAYPIIWERWPKHPYRNKRHKPREGRTPKERKAIARYELKRMRAWPFDIRAVHPKSIFLDLFHDPIEDIIEEQVVALGQFAQEYPHLNLSQRSTTKTAKLVTYCSEEDYALYLDGTPLLTAADDANEDGVAPNTTGILWYKTARSGYGERTYKGEPEYLYKGILRDGRHLLLAQIVNFNVMEAIRMIQGFPNFSAEGDTKEQAAKETADFTFGSGEIWNHDKRVTLRPIELPNVPPVVFEQLKLLDDMLGVHFGPYKDALRGGYADETLGGLRTRRAVAQMPYQATDKSCSQAVAAMLMDICYFIKHELQEPLYCGRDLEPITPDEIVDGMRLIVDFSPPTEEEKALKKQALMEERKLGLVSTRRYLEADEDVEDVDEEEARLLADKLLATPQVIAALTGEVVQEFMAEEGKTPPSPQPGEVPAPGGFTRPGEQPPTPIAGSAQDMQRQNGALGIPQLAPYGNQ